MSNTCDGCKWAEWLEDDENNGDCKYPGDQIKLPRHKLVYRPVLDRFDMIVRYWEYEKPCACYETDGGAK